MQLKGGRARGYYPCIAHGEELKTVEGRLGKGEFAEMRAGDRVTFYNDDIRGVGRETTVTLRAVTRHPSFAALLEDATLERVLPVAEIRTVRQGVRVYRQFYTAADERAHGVLGLRW